MSDAAGAADGTRFRRGCGDAATYAALATAAARLANAAPELRLARLCDLLWDALSPRGLSWIGFYLVEGCASAEPTEMTLAARRDKPACSPIGVHGVCGQGYLEEAIRLVEDVALLGPGYIACDPRDRSEVVVPIYRNGARWGVLDADSHEVGCFGDADVAGFSTVLAAAGLLDRRPPIRADRLRSAAGTV